jgi:hypothetical protein
MEVNLVAVALATVVMFAIGGFWYMVPFGSVWGKIHGFDKLSKKEQERMQKQMGPWYGVQLVVTVISAFVLAALISLMPSESPYFVAFLVWLGFVLPTEASAMIFGGSPEGYVWQKIGISTTESLVHLLAAAWVITLFA